MCLQLLSLDRDLGAFLRCSTERCGLCGCADRRSWRARHPERLRLHGVADAARIDPALTPKAVGDAVTRQTGIAGPILANIGVTGDLYLDPHLQGAERQRALDAALAIYRAHPQVAAAFSRDEIAATPAPVGDPVGWSVIQRVRASFDPARSGDLYVVLKPHITPIADTTAYVATHGSPWDYDRRVPILFWRPGLVGSTVQAPVETTDIMPTLAGMIGLSLAPGSVDGHCLDDAPACHLPFRAKHLKTRAFLSIFTFQALEGGREWSWGNGARAGEGCLDAEMGCCPGVFRSACSMERLRSDQAVCGSFNSPLAAGRL